MFGDVKEATTQFLVKYQSEPWVRGKHDCVMFLHKYLTEVYENPFFDPSYYPYSGYKSARKALIRLLKDQGALTLADLLDGHYYRVLLPVDCGLVAKPDTEGLTGYTYGVTYDCFGFFVGEEGIKAHELNPTTDLYWSVT